MSPIEAGGPPCSQQSLAVREPLAGTAASGVEHWLVLELAGAWAPKILDCDGLPAEVADRLREWERDHPRSRLQLVRRPEVREGEGREFHVVSAGLKGSRSLGGHLASWDDFLGLDLGTILREGRDPGGALERTDGEMFLVCGHGRRDACCAKLGQPIYRRLRQLAPEATWTTSHTGGHRFAPTLVHLPSGLCFGRLEESECEKLVAACRAGTIHDLQRVRGRCCLSAAAQAAEVFLRRSGRLDCVGVEEQVGEDGSVAVEFTAASGARHMLRVRREPLEAEPIEVSCIGGKRKPPMAWTVVG